MNSSKSKRKEIIALICCIAMLISSSFALFYRETGSSFAAQAGQAGVLASWSFTSSPQNGFTDPGDTVTGTLDLENTGSTPLTYEFIFSLPYKTGLENATLVYIDDALVGNLGYLCRFGGNGDNIYVLPAYTLDAGETFSHTVTLEYHIGASDFYQGKSFSLQVDCYGRQILNTDGIT